ncbi:MAG: hypothetical protein RLZZ574_149 [Cyanobacteriota bacterium]
MLFFNYVNLVNKKLNAIKCSHPFTWHFKAYRASVVPPSLLHALCHVPPTNTISLAKVIRTKPLSYSSLAVVQVIWCVPLFFCGLGKQSRQKKTQIAPCLFLSRLLRSDVSNNYYSLRGYGRKLTQKKSVHARFRPAFNLRGASVRPRLLLSMQPSPGRLAPQPLTPAGAACFRLHKSFSGKACR